LSGGIEKDHKNLNHDNRSPARNLNPGPHEYEAGALTARLRHSIRLDMRTYIHSIALDRALASLTGFVIVRYIRCGVRLDDMFNVYQYYRLTWNTCTLGFLHKERPVAYLWVVTVKTGAAVAQLVQCLTTGWTTGVRSLTVAEDFFSSPCVQTGSGVHPASYPMGTGGPFPGGKARPGRDADHSHPSSAEVKNE
jgi:hypothetical protein